MNLLEKIYFMLSKFGFHHFIFVLFPVLLIYLDNISNNINNEQNIQSKKTKFIKK